MVIAIIFDGDDQDKISRLVLGMDRSKIPPWYWNFPGGPVRSEDVVPNRIHDDFEAAGNAVKRIVKKRTGLTVHAQVIQVRWRPNTGDNLYIFAGVADFNELVHPTGERVVQVFSADEIKKLDDLFPVHHIAFHQALKWIHGETE